MPEAPGLAEQHAPAMLAELGGVKVWQVLNQVVGDNRQKVVQLAQQFDDSLLECLFL